MDLSVVLKSINDFSCRKGGLYPVNKRLDTPIRVKNYYPFLIRELIDKNYNRNHFSFRENGLEHFVGTGHRVCSQKGQEISLISTYLWT